MRFDYLWDEPDNTLLLRFPASAMDQMVGLLVSADGSDGRHWPLLGIALSRLPKDDPEMIVLHVPLPEADLAGKAPLYVTVEPICGDTAYRALPAERVALVRGTPPPNAIVNYWCVDPQDAWARIQVHDQPPQSGDGDIVLGSARSADTIFPAGRVMGSGREGAVRIAVRTEAYPAGLAHVLLMQATNGAHSVLQVHALMATPDVCHALVPADLRDGPEAGPLPPPLTSVDLARAPRDGVELRVHSGAVEPGLQGGMLPTVVQFLDRLVISTTPPMPLELGLEGRAVGPVSNPLVLVQKGNGTLDLDNGRLQQHLSDVLAPQETLAFAPMDDAAASAPFVEVVRRQLVEQIARALPSAANLRPVHADALRNSPSLYQTLAWFNLGRPDSSQQTALRQRFSPLRGEADTLRELCRTLISQMQRELLQRPPTDLDRARIEAWVTRPAPTPREAAHHCVVVLGWEPAADLVLLGCRPDPLHLVRADDPELDSWRQTALGRFNTLYGLGMLNRSANDLLVDVADIPAATDRINADWDDVVDSVATAQVYIGFHPPLALEVLSSAPDVARPHRALVLALQGHLAAGLAQGPGTGAATIAETLALRMASRLNEDFRKVLALVQRENLSMPMFFAAGPGVAEGAGGFAPAAILPASISEAESLSDWLIMRVEDMPLLRSWKADLRTQLGRRPTLHAEDVRRPV